LPPYPNQKKFATIRIVLCGAFLYTCIVKLTIQCDNCSSAMTPVLHIISSIVEFYHEALLTIPHCTNSMFGDVLQRIAKFFFRKIIVFIHLFFMSRHKAHSMNTHTAERRLIKTNKTERSTMHWSRQTPNGLFMLIHSAWETYQPFSLHLKSVSGTEELHVNIHLMFFFCR